jgi:hypothetical protein
MFLFNCQDNFIEDEIIEETAKENLLENSVQARSKPKKKIKYKGHNVNHRFLASENELKEKHSKKYLKKLYNKLRKKHRENGNVASKDVDLDLPNQEAILEAAKVVLPQFPYEKIEGYNGYGLEEEGLINVNLIKTDFSEMSSIDIENNVEIIDEYYSQNLDYLVLNEIAQYPEIYSFRSKASEEAIYIGTMTEALLNGYGFIRSTIAYGLAGNNSTTSSENYYPNIEKYNTREDAYRHILWNAMLAQYYWTILPSKNKRLGFAALVTNCREILSPNDPDSSEMDYHNNFIGRHLWDVNTGYRRIFGISVGVKLKSTSELKDIMHNQVESYGCFIIKDHPNGTEFDYTALETKAMILPIDIYTPVYFVGPIIPQTYRTVKAYDYSDCPGYLNKNNEIKESDRVTSIILPEDQDCAKEIYTTVPVNSCFLSKDINFNPYN